MCENNFQQQSSYLIPVSVFFKILDCDNNRYHDIRQCYRQNHLTTRKCFLANMFAKLSVRYYISTVSNSEKFQ